MEQIDDYITKRKNQLEIANKIRKNLEEVRKSNGNQLKNANPSYQSTKADWQVGGVNVTDLYDFAEEYYRKNWGRKEYDRNLFVICGDQDKKSKEENGNLLDSRLGLLYLFTQRTLSESQYNILKKVAEIYKSCKRK